MKRWFWFCGCTALAAVMLLLGWLTPIYLRAVDVSVLQRAGRETPSLVARGLELLGNNKLGAAQLLSEAARQTEVPEGEKLARALRATAARDPAAMVWGGAASARLENLFRNDPRLPKSGTEPLTDFVVRLENRDQVLDLLRASSLPAVHELLQCRSLTNTVIFPPSSSAAGQAFDAAISIGGLLVQEGYVTPGFGDSLLALASQANRGANSRPLEGLGGRLGEASLPQANGGANSRALEEALMDLISLGQRLNWGQMAVLVSHVGDAQGLNALAGAIRAAGPQLPVLYSSVELSGKPAAVAGYALNFSETGLGDLAASLRYGTGGVDELVRRGQRLYVPSSRQGLTALAPARIFFAVAANYAWRVPALALAVKWFFYLSSGFYLAMALHFIRPARWDLPQPTPARGARLGREVLFAMGSLLVVLLLSEPFLAQENQRLDLPIRLQLPMVGSVVPAGIARVSPSVMTQSLLTLLLFFVLQALIYTACLVKLAEIRRQKTPTRIKLMLLENEEHLFDAGLYLGFAGTIVSLIMVSLGVIKNPSLMAAYSSTAFGIIFVSIFKIFHLRPARRLMLLDAERASDEPQAALPEASLLTHS